MKQRVAIARALANQPRILLMDEPFGALDAQTRCRMQAHLLEIWRKIDITIVFITHDLDEAIYLADRILVLSAHPGRVQELIEVPVPRPRSTTQCFSPEFLATKARLEELIYSGRSRRTRTTIPSFPASPKSPTTWNGDEVAGTDMGRVAGRSCRGARNRRSCRSARPSSTVRISAAASMR